MLPYVSSVPSPLPRFQWRSAPGYIEMLAPLEGQPIVTATYITWLNDLTPLVVTCWEHRFEKLLNLIRDPTQGKAWLTSFARIWPAFTGLVNNTLDARYQDGAVVQLRDPDDAETKWFVGTFVRNIQSNDVTELFQDEGVQAAAAIIEERSSELFNEFQRDDLGSIDKARTYFHGGSSSSREGLAWQSKVSDALAWISPR